MQIALMNILSDSLAIELCLDIICVVTFIPAPKHDADDSCPEVCRTSVYDDSGASYSLNMISERHHLKCIMKFSFSRHILLTFKRSQHGRRASSEASLWYERTYALNHG